MSVLLFAFLYKAKKLTKQHLMGFANRTSKFIVSMAFINGFLTSEDDTILQRCKQMEDALGVCGKLEKDIKAKQAEIDSLISRLMK